MAQSFKWGGKTWGPNDKAAFAAWLKKRGVQYNAWAARNRRGAAVTFEGRPAPPPPSLNDVVNRRVKSSVAPLFAGVEADRARATKDYERTMANQKGLLEAVARIIGGDQAGAGVSSAYDTAAGGVASFGKGFSDAMQGLSNQAGGEATRLLSLAGAPDSAIASTQAATGVGTGVGDVLYGLGGAIPASTLEREGAGFASYASLFPKFQAMQTAVTGRKLASGYQDQLSEIDRQKAEIRAKIPGIREEVLNAIIDDQRAQDQLDINREYLGLKEKSDYADATGYYQGPDGKWYKTRDARNDDKKTSGKAKEKREAAIAAREKAWNDARQDIFAAVEDAAKGTKVKVKDPKRPWLPPTETVKVEEYAVLKKRLFAQYKHLLKYATRSGQPALKRRLNAIIDEALAAYGIKKPKAKTTKKDTQPDRPSHL